MGRKRLLSCSFLARSTKKTSYCLARHAVIGGNLAKGVLILKDTAQHVRPFVRGNTLFCMLGAWTLLCGEGRGNTAKYLL